MEGVKPELNTDDLRDDIRINDLTAPSPLSWKRKDINTQVVDPGWQNKFNIRMIVQVRLSVMYAIVYGLSFTGLNAYYEWPLEPGTTTTTTGPEVNLESILTDEEYFACEDTTFYLNETGPILYQSNVVYDSTTHNLLTLMGTYWGISIAFFVAFIIVRLYFGQYNQLLLLVKFKKDKDGKVKPVKLSFAYTVMYNAKSFSNVVFKDLCKFFISILRQPCHLVSTFVI